MSRIRFMNTEIDNLTMSEALEAADMLIRQKKNAFVVTPNTDHIVKLETDQELREVYAHADLILADGKFLVNLSKLCGNRIKEKVSGSDLFPRLCRLAAEKGYTMFFLGAAEGVAAKAAQNLKEKYPGLNVVGTYSPPYGFEKNTEEVKKVIKMVRETSPDILIVGLGAPKQEKFIYGNLKELNVPLSLGLGASLDFEAGNVKRAPKWMSEAGFEWLFRFFQEPKRLFRRYFVDDVRILALALKYRKNR